MNNAVASIRIHTFFSWTYLLVFDDFHSFKDVVQHCPSLSKFSAAFSYEIARNRDLKVGLW